MPVIIEDVEPTRCDCCKGEAYRLHLSCGHVRLWVGYVHPARRDGWAGEPTFCNEGCGQEWRKAA